MAAVCLTGSIICLAATAQTAEKTNYVPVTTAEEAVERALAYTGFDKLEGLDTKDRWEMARLTIARDSTTPFLSDSIDGHTAWRVTFEGVILDIEEYSDEVEVSHPKDFEVLIDSVTGRLFSVISRYKGKARDFLPEVPAEIAEEQLRMSFEEYLCFVPVPPVMTLCEAINGSIFGSAMHSKEIVALYIEHSYHDSAAIPVWVVHLFWTSPEKVDTRLS